ncbi:RNA-binding protein [Trypanosoma conorhini]|uniref:RNA-binding protein n=1 Tax=Trypanosoma conorhini TaxID=83891 RepID=A0A3S5IUN7_9TRYP|nr:RNA-binding protein [Trypanosoma conorhini]RNF26992.1 RNA-binding protein [Trypanosoma conorhini]
MTTGADPRNLIVNYIPTPVSDESLRRLFERFGPLVSARVIRDRKKGEHPKGYGFVVYADPESGLAAMEAMNGFEIHNKRLRVSPAFGPGNAQSKSTTSPGVAAQERRLGGYMAPLPSAEARAPLQHAVGPVDLGPRRREPAVVPFQGMPPLSFSQTFCAPPLVLSSQKLTIMNAVPVQFYAAPNFVFAPAADGTRLVATALHPQGSTAPNYSPPPPTPPSLIAVPNTAGSSNVTYARLNGTTLTNSNNVRLGHNGDSGIRRVPSQAATTIRFPSESSYPALLQPLSFPPSVSLLPASDPTMPGSGSTYFSSLGSLEVASVTASSKP